MARVVDALALKRALRGDVRLHRDSQAAQLSENTPSTLHIPMLLTLQGSGLAGRLWKHPGNGVRNRAEDSLDTNNQSLQFLLDDILRHLSSKILEEEMHTAILWEKDGVKTHTLALIKGSQGNGHGSEAISSPWDIQQLSPLIWAERLLGHNPLNHIRMTCISLNRDISGGLILLLACGSDTFKGHLGI